MSTKLAGEIENHSVSLSMAAIEGLQESKVDAKSPNRDNDHSPLYTQPCDLSSHILRIHLPRKRAVPIITDATEQDHEKGLQAERNLQADSQNQAVEKVEEKVVHPEMVSATTTTIQEPAVELRSAHNTEALFKCLADDCGAAFVTYVAFREHIQSQHPQMEYHSVNNDAWTQLLDSLEYEFTKETHDSPKQVVEEVPSIGKVAKFSCPECEFSSSRGWFSKLTSHVEAEHADRKDDILRACYDLYNRVPCAASCGKTYMSERLMHDHYKRMHRDQPPLPELPRKRVGRPRKRAKTENEPGADSKKKTDLKCPSCSFIANSYVSLVNHVDDSHDDGNIKADIIESLQAMYPRVACKLDTCSKTFTTQRAMSQHYRLVHVPDGAPKISAKMGRHVRTDPEKGIKCPGCARVRGNYDSLRQHISDDHPENRADLAALAREMYSKERKFVCLNGHCDRVFTKKHSMLNHFNREHHGSDGVSSSSSEWSGSSSEHSDGGWRSSQSDEP